MKVYLAARFSRLAELNGYRAELEALGIEVTSRWLRGGHEWSGVPDHDIPIGAQARFAAEDLEDIDAADVVVCFTEAPGTGPARGGRHVEMGYAIARGKTVLIVGHRENVFCCLPSVAYTVGWECALDTLDFMHEEERQIA